MSIDPAIESHRPLETALPFDRLLISRDDVYVFDFDGVISSSFEDDVYRLPPTESELSLITAAAQKFGIRCEGMEQQYQRHLIFQAAAWKLKLPIEPGPGLTKTKAASKSARLFVLTARSGWYAPLQPQHRPLIRFPRETLPPRRNQSSATTRVTLCGYFRAYLVQQPKMPSSTFSSSHQRDERGSVAFSNSEPLYQSPNSPEGNESIFSQ